MTMGEGKPDGPNRYGGRLEAAFFWFLFGGFFFSLIVMVPASLAGVEGGQLRILVGSASVVLALVGAVTRLKPPGFP